ncbi:MAG: MCE family protein [Candidatus Aminicenantes bacterium]|nr:MCE family protein [Candidatus Aminicenantes bacterium]
MLKKEQKFRLRMFLLISMLILVFILALFIYPGLVEERDRYFINFRMMSVSGLSEGSTVKYQGVDIGSVVDVRVNPDDLSSILVYVEIDKGFPVKKDMRAKLSYTGITGLKFVELSGGENKSENLKPNGEIATIKGLGEKAEDIVSNIDAAVRGINRFLSKDNQKKLSLFLENIEKTSEIISTVVEKKKKSLLSSIDNVEEATLQISKTADLLKQQIEKLELDKIAVKSKKAVENFSHIFSDEELGSVVKGIDDFVSSANSTLRKLNMIIVNQQEEMKHSLVKLSEVIENLSAFTRNLVEDPTILIRKRVSKRRKQ